MERGEPWQVFGQGSGYMALIVSLHFIYRRQGPDASGTGHLQEEEILKMKLLLSLLVGLKKREKTGPSDVQCGYNW